MNPTARCVLLACTLVGFVAAAEDNPLLGVFISDGDRRVSKMVDPDDKVRDAIERDATAALPVGRARMMTWDPLESTCRHASLSIL